jgi:hypothetical protein
MGHWVEAAVVGLVVGGAVFWAVRAGLRSARKGQVCSTCGDASSCPLAGKDPTAQELKQLGGDCCHHS